MNSMNVPLNFHSNDRQPSGPSWWLVQLVWNAIFPGLSWLWGYLICWALDGFWSSPLIDAFVVKIFPKSSGLFSALQARTNLPHVCVCKSARMARGNDANISSLNSAKNTQCTDHTSVWTALPRYTYYNTSAILVHLRACPDGHVV